MPCAMAKLDASSTALLTLRPVDTRFWTTSRRALTEFRFCSATNAPTFVLIELLMGMTWTLLF